MTHRLFLQTTSLLAAIFCSSALLAQPKVGDVFPAWTEGYLDIHHINTGKGECTFMMLPDGTTMLVDAGATSSPKPRVTDPKPNADRTPGEWISRYILRMLQKQAEKKINYVLVTHFHGDHIGDLSPGMKTSKAGYVLSGITEVGEQIAFDKLVDRAWPDYDYPQKLGVANYIQFVRWHVDNKGVRAEKFRIGAHDQFSLVYQPEKYPNFEIRNIASNGEIWTGVGNNTRHHFPPIESLSSNQYPNENMCSNAFRLSYGKFDYFNGGDIVHFPPCEWQEIETAVGKVAGPVDVCLAPHHANFDATGLSFIQAVRPRVWIIQVWGPAQPAGKVLFEMFWNRSYPGPRDIFSTNLMYETKIVVGENANRMKSTQGHIVIRVNPDGNDYMIYILDDSEESFKIKAIHGPYICE